MGQGQSAVLGYQLLTSTRNHSVIEVDLPTCLKHRGRPGSLCNEMCGALSLEPVVKMDDAEYIEAYQHIFFILPT